MRGRGGWAQIWVAVLLSAGACSTEMANEPGSPETTATSSSDIPTDLASLAGPMTLMIVATNAGVLVGTPAGDSQFYDNGDPGKLAMAAATAGIPVCSIELGMLVTPPAPAGAVAQSVAAAMDQCSHQNLTSDLAELRQLQTPSTVVIVGANAAETVGSTNNGVNYFYGADVLGMLHAARTLDVTACVVAPQNISLPMYPLGATPGVSIPQALASCGL